MSPFQTVKIWLVNHLGLAKDALHIYVGLTLFFGTALLFGWKLSSWRPWAVVAAAALAGEVWDLRDCLVHQIPIDLWANWHDLWNTLFWPTIIMVLARRTRLLGR